MGNITIIPYQSRWTSEFEAIAGDIRAAALDNALRVDHIGSTSIPGLAAKDVIDIQITVADLANERVSTALQSLGMVERPDANDLLVGEPTGSDELKKRFWRNAQGERLVHIHVRELGRLNQSYPLLFRDYLRRDEYTRMAYQQIKEALAERFPNDAEAYYAIKDPYMDTVYRAALRWAEVTQWQMDEDYR